MTFKAIVKMMIEQEADAWVRKLMDEAGFQYNWTSCTIQELTADKNYFGWTAYVDITSREGGYTHKRVEVGGTVDDITGICCSCIWNQNHELIWMAVPETRKALGISEFKIA